MEAEGGWPGQVLGLLWEEPGMSAGGGSRAGSEVGNEARWRLSLVLGLREGAGFAGEVEKGIRLGIGPKVGMGLGLKLELRWV